MPSTTHGISTIQKSWCQRSKATWQCRNKLSKYSSLLHIIHHWGERKWWCLLFWKILLVMIFPWAKDHIKILTFRGTITFKVFIFPTCMYRLWQFLLVLINFWTSSFQHQVSLDDNPLPSSSLKTFFSCLLMQTSHQKNNLDRTNDSSPFERNDIFFFQMKAMIYQETHNLSEIKQ